MDPFAAEVVRLSDPALVRLKGDLDLAVKSDLLALLEPVFAEGSGRVEVDLAEVSFIDSSVISVLVQLQHLGEELNRPLVVRNPSAVVDRVLKVSGVDSMISIERDDGGPSD